MTRHLERIALAVAATGFAVFLTSTYGAAINRALGPVLRAIAGV